MKIHLLTGKVLVEDLRIDGVHPGDRPFFTAKRIDVALDWVPAFARRPDITISSVEMTDWQMLVERWDGGHNFPRFTHDDGKPPGPKRMTTTLKWLRAYRGQFAFEDHETPWGVVCPNLDINITNNSFTTEPRRSQAAAKWASKWMVWLQDQLLTWAFFV